MTTLPVATPVTTPLLGSTEAIDELLLDHTPPEVASANVIVLPVQTTVGPEMAATVGGGFTLIVAKVSAEGHPLALPWIVKIDVCDVVVVLVRFPPIEERNPEALGSIPIKFPEVFVLFHVAEVNAGVLVHAMVKSSPEQTVSEFVGGLLGDVKVITGV
jgi:hypothetical protein